jgi:hypothetical protein
MEVGAVASTSSLRGYVLEELLAWLLQRSGYSLLVSEDQDPNALCSAGNGLRVRGRGADHQVDVLGELSWPIPYSLPVRLFLEAKYREKPVGLADVRNALGVLNDVNEHYSTATALKADPQPFDRYHYRYSLFSASGFTIDAQRYAYTQQISLVDLGGRAFRGLLDAAARAADELQALHAASNLGAFPVNQMREAFRRALGTWTAAHNGHEHSADAVDDDFEAARGRATHSATALSSQVLPADSLAEIASRLLEVDGALYFGVTAAPFLLLLQPDDPAAFDDLIRNDRDPQQARLAFAGSEGLDGEWAFVTGDTTVLRLGLAPFYEQFLLTETPSRRDRRDRRADGLRTVTVLGETSDVSLRFDPLSPGDAGEPYTERTDWFRARQADPSLIYRDESDLVDLTSPRWPRAAVARLVSRLRNEKRHAQAEVIVAAARQGGFINREDVYQIAEYPMERTLRGFTRPVKRIAGELRSDGLIPEDAPHALVAIYDHGVLATRFQVPPEFVEFAEIDPSVFD